MSERQSQAVVDPALHAGVDIGMDNLAAITSDKPGFVPRVSTVARSSRSTSSTTSARPSCRADLGRPG